MVHVRVLYEIWDKVSVDFIDAEYATKTVSCLWKL
ncbi:hypothetical protein T02_5759 [Trichinella nativa]|uniref:Uncharacterized protein n=1 Tax=Trichinella nativa TaxID=6335 RepID=A0A0V1JZX7_9BILA|nr:hypothetical protein T02_5759 [Trichinella nativa]